MRTLHTCMAVVVVVVVQHSARVLVMFLASAQNGACEMCSAAAGRDAAEIYMGQHKHTHTHASAHARAHGHSALALRSLDGTRVAAYHSPPRLRKIM